MTNRDILEERKIKSIIQEQFTEFTRININKEKVSTPEQTISPANLLNDKYILVQKGKKDYYIIKVI